MSRFAYSIFSDDVRHEVNGKTSLIGVYQGTMYIPEFPAHLPKLCISISVVTPIDRPFENVVFKVFMDDNQLFEIPLTQAQIEQSLSFDPQASVARFQKIQAMGVLSPISFEAPCKLRIEVEADGENIDCSGLHVLKAPEGMQLIS